MVANRVQPCVYVTHLSFTTSEPPPPFPLKPCNVSVLSKGQLWSVCGKLEHAVAIQRKVILMTAAAERWRGGGHILHVFPSNGPIFSQGEISGGMAKREEGGEIERNTGEELWLSLQEVTHYYFFICVFFSACLFFKYLDLNECEM